MVYAVFEARELFGTQGKRESLPLEALIRRLMTTVTYDIIIYLAMTCKI